MEQQQQALVFALPGNRYIAESLCAREYCAAGHAEIRTFPDGETYVRIDSDVQERTVVIVCSLSRPDAHIMPLYFLAKTARDLGAARIILLAPYLAYMRQDCRFRPGEALSSRYFAELLCACVDELLTVDPHLHRWKALDDIYHIPTSTLHAAEAIARWLRDNISHPLLIGPDEESAQWTGEVARLADAPHVILAKVRRGDRDVQVSEAPLRAYADCTPVLVDDIISTARTMIDTIGHVRAAGMAAPVCIAVHAVFADSAYVELRQAGAARVVSCNTISHASNAIDLAPLLADALRALLEK